MLSSMFHLHLLINWQISVSMFQMSLMCAMVPLERDDVDADCNHVCSLNSFASSFLAKYLPMKVMPNRLYGDSGS